MSFDDETDSFTFGFNHSNAGSFAGNYYETGYETIADFQADGASEDWSTNDKLIIGDRVYVFRTGALGQSFTELSADAWADHDRITVNTSSQTLAGVGQNGDNAFYTAPYSDVILDEVIYQDVEINGVIYTTQIGVENNFNTTQALGIEKFVINTLDDILADVAEISYKDGYDDGYKDGYKDGYDDGFADGAASQ